MLFLGLDLGTQGVRVVIADEQGQVAGAGSVPFETVTADRQDPALWWRAACQALGDAVAGLTPPHKASDVAAVAVDSTSGTVLPVDRDGSAIGEAIMYCDTCAQDEAEAVCDAAADFIARAGYRFNAAFGLPKILWLKNHRPDLFDKAHKIVHPTDFLNGKLCGTFDVTDDTNALKSGYDLVEGKWPVFIEEKLGIPHAKLPRVTAPGQPLGTITPEAAKQTGLRAGTAVVTGMTDGTASFVSSGAVREGEFNATLGTTLVVKGTTRRRIADPSGALYCARHPRGEGWWLPGGGSFAGGAYVSHHFPGDRAAELEREAASLVPTGIRLYPLVADGERFPFIEPKARAFAQPEPVGDAQHLAAAMEGVGCVERWIYERIGELGTPVGGDIHTSGGGCRSDLWLQIRADITRRRMHVPAVAEAALGSAIHAANAHHYHDLPTACDKMISIRRSFEPQEEMAARYDEQYATFRAACTKRGYI